MSNSPLITKFEKLVKDLNTIIFGDDDQDVILDDTVKPTISKWLRSIVTDLNDVIDIAAAAGAGANGWTAQLIVDASGVTQQEINNGLNSIAEMLAISNPKSGNRVYVKSYHEGLNKGGGFFVYDLTKAGVNDGGVVINGWVRQDESNLDVYMFGAYGDWNATTQQGSDDSMAFQHYAEYLNKNMLNPRDGGGKKVMFARGGSYRLKGFTITQDESAYWSFLLKGESQYTQLWFDPAGSGIVLQNENSRFRDITLNGNITTSSVGAIDYIVTGKLKNKMADVDVVCDNVSVMFYKNFAKIHGRGFTFRNGNAGKGTGVVCEINTDDIVFGGSHSGDTPEGGLRHYVFSESRIDDVSGVFSVVGSGAAKDHIHGIQITGNQIKSCSNLIRSTDCTIRRVVLAKNAAFGLKTIALVPKIDGLVDMGNQWANEWRAITPSQSESSRLAWGYACSSYVRNALVCGSQFNDLYYNLFMIGKDTYLSTANPMPSHNINVVDNTFLNFGVNEALKSSVIDNATELTAVSIEKNFLQGNAAHVKNWINGLPDKSDSIIIKNNINRAGFIQQQLSFTPKLYIGSIEKNVTESQSYYSVDDNYIDVTTYLYFPKTLLDGSSGVLSFSLPTNTYQFEKSAISLAFSGSGVVEQAVGFTNRPTYVSVNRTTMRLELKSSSGTDISTSDVSASTSGCVLNIKYRAKVRAT